MCIMSQLKSHHIQHLYVTLSSLFDPNPNLQASPKQPFLFYSKIRITCCRHRGALENCSACKRGFATLKPNNQQLRSRLICIQCSHILRDNVKVQISQQPCLKHKFVWNSVSSASDNLLYHLAWTFVNQNVLFNDQCF